VRRLEVEVGATWTRLPLAVGALAEQQVEAVLYPIIVTSVDPKALQAVGAWPFPEQLVDRLLLDASADAAENAHSDEERSRAGRALDDDPVLAGAGSSTPPAARSPASPSPDRAVGALTAAEGRPPSINRSPTADDTPAAAAAPTVD
jgi:hypothetical protein